MLVLLFLAVILLTYSNGANDNFKGVATLWGSGTLAYKPRPDAGHSGHFCRLYLLVFFCR